MNKKFNRRKFFYLDKNKYYLILIFIILFGLFFYIYNNSKKIEKTFINSIENFSTKLNYTFNYYEITGLKNIAEEEIIKIIKPYLKKSIFLLPLQNISNLIYENNWVKNVNLKINYKDKIFIEIFEYEPIGIYSFNDKYYYFNSDGKIINFVSINELDKLNYIIFIGKKSTLMASNLLNEIKIIDKTFHEKIYKANFIENRRWNLILKENIILKLSETDIKGSINNYLELKNKLTNEDIIEIGMIDLRYNQKAIIELKK